jgi:protein tyrosine phosphatase (PTP) superfamily phosphohydrolase (DUF442 family)
MPGLHNVLRVNDRLYSGSSPDGDAGFESLKSLGVRTIITVDGARPDVERARKHGLRYVHLPIGYDGVPREQALRIARAVRDLPGPVYLHCHHGKHRAPAAAAAARLCLDESCTVADAATLLKEAGTAPHYKGLHAAVGLRRPAPGELDAVAADFPEVAEVPSLVRVMVELDGRWERLTLARRAGWKAPEDHPDVDPPHEAVQLWEQYREAARLPEVQAQPESFRRWLGDGERAAKELADALTAGKLDAAKAAFEASAKACADCHARHRDAPK